MIDQYVESASTYAGDIDGVILVILAIVGFWFLLAQAVFFGLIFKFAAKPGVKAQYISGEKAHEKRWVALPHYATLVFDVIIVVMAVKVWHEVKINLPPADSTVRVIAQQWAWTFVHPGPDNTLDTADDISVVDELHVEKGKTYHFELTSRDVLHSFSVPVFRLKQDAIPGRVIKGWFNATQTGQFDIQCTEICGIGHAIMPARILIESEAQHRLWNQANTPKLADAAPTTLPTSAGGMP
jgi:cytochrome c oxidase subunit II